MADNEQKMGYEGIPYYGVKGTTATTPIPETRDMSITFSTEKGATKTREPDGSIPIGTERVTGRNWQFDVQVLNVPTDAVVVAMLAAAYAGEPIALRLKDHAAGKGYDGDVTLEFKHGMSLNGEQTLDFTCKPTRSAGRRPQLYV